MKRHNYLLALAILAVTALIALEARAEDMAALRPPKGATVALIVFEDLECPDCARAAPLVAEASRTYKIPVVVHDFPLPKHPWAFDAAVMARYFDSQSKKLGSEFREQVFQHQVEITPENLRAFADKFATEHKVDLPFVIDPQGKLADEVKADRDLGIRVGINHTPTIYVVSSKTQGKPFVEVVDRSQLFQMIEDMKQE